MRVAVRNAIGQAMFRTGSVMYRSGLWLCGIAGWWDAGTDRPSQNASGGASDG